MFKRLNKKLKKKKTKHKTKEKRETCHFRKESRTCKKASGAFYNEDRIKKLHVEKDIL